MEVHLPPELQAKLTRLAAEQGCGAEALVEKAVERFVDYDAWFLHEVEKGMAAADRGELIDHEEVARLIDRRYPG
jgi:predicted transcriptional regulator